jgi:hypothetical protein
MARVQLPYGRSAHPIARVVGSRLLKTAAVAAIHGIWGIVVVL